MKKAIWNAKAGPKKIKQHQLRRVWPWLSLSSRTSHCRGFGHRGGFDRPVTPIEGDQLMWVDVMGCHVTSFSFFATRLSYQAKPFSLTRIGTVGEKNGPESSPAFQKVHPKAKKGWEIKPLWHHNGLLSLTGTTTSPSGYFCEPPRPSCGTALSKCDKILGFCKKTLYQRTVLFFLSPCISILADIIKPLNNRTGTGLHVRT